MIKVQFSHHILPHRSSLQIQQEDHQELDVNVLHQRLRNRKFAQKQGEPTGNKNYRAKYYLLLRQLVKRNKWERVQIQS